jgi:RNA polymerase sigma factor (sigma-70 family)
MLAESTVFVIDDDPDIRASLQRLFEAVRIRVELFESAERFLQAGRVASPGCLLLDVRMPGMGGMSLLTHLQSVKPHPPVILLTGHGDIPMVLQALKSGALDFIEKPANHQRILESVQNAFEIDRQRRAQEAETRHFHASLASLSAREREVFELMIEGVPNKVIALNLGISERTLEKHRKQIMEKMGTRSLAELIRTALLNGQTLR